MYDFQDLPELYNLHALYPLLNTKQPRLLHKTPINYLFLETAQYNAPNSLIFN